MPLKRAIKNMKWKTNIIQTKEEYKTVKTVEVEGKYISNSQMMKNSSCKSAWDQKITVKMRILTETENGKGDSLETNKRVSEL